MDKPKKKQRNYAATGQEDPNYERAANTFNEDAYRSSLQGPPAISQFLNLFEGPATHLEQASNLKAAKRVRAGAMIASEDIFSEEPARIFEGSFRYLSFLDRTFEGSRMVEAGRLVLQQMMTDSAKQMAQDQESENHK